MNLLHSNVEEALKYAEGVLDRTALSIGARTHEECEREFRYCISMAMGGIRQAIRTSTPEESSANFRALLAERDELQLEVNRLKQELDARREDIERGSRLSSGRVPA